MPEYLKIERPGEAPEMRGPYKSEAIRAAAKREMLKTPGTVCTVTDEKKNPLRLVYLNRATKTTFYAAYTPQNIRDAAKL